MNRIGFAALAFAGFCNMAAAGEISSAYTDLDAEKDCTTFASARKARATGPIWSAADIAAIRCSPGGDLAPAWESFSAFNSAGPRIEWRIETDKGRAIPYAAIHRWFVSADAENPDKKTEVLVIEKVGQIDQREGCTVGLVLATGNPRANEAARRIADERARNFACGQDQRVVVGDPMPDFSRSEN